MHKQKLMRLEPSHLISGYKQEKFECIGRGVQEQIEKANPKDCRPPHSTGIEPWTSHGFLKLIEMEVRVSRKTLQRV